MLAVGLIRKRGCDLLNVDATQIEHPLRVEPQPGTWKDRVNGVVAPCTRGGKTRLGNARIAA